MSATPQDQPERGPNQQNEESAPNREACFLTFDDRGQPHCDSQTYTEPDSPDRARKR